MAKDKTTQVTIPNMTWTSVNVDGQNVWVYQQTGHNVGIVLSLTPPHSEEIIPVKHKNVFDHEEKRY